jgi:hypothetical protein
MQPFLIVYAKGVVHEVIEVLCEVSKNLDHTLWSIEGKPCSMHPSRLKIAIRVCIIGAMKVDLHQIPEDKVLGLVHVARVPHIPSECRISFYLKDLSGESLVSPDERTLKIFCDRFVRLLEIKGIKTSDGPESAETVPLNRPPLVQNDTGPLPA